MIVNPPMNSTSHASNVMRILRVWRLFRRVSDEAESSCRSLAIVSLCTLKLQYHVVRIHTDLNPKSIYFNHKNDADNLIRYYLLI